MDTTDLPYSQVPTKNPGKDGIHGFFIKLVDRDCVKMTKEARCYWIPPTTCKILNIIKKKKLENPGCNTVTHHLHAVQQSLFQSHMDVF